MQQLLLFLFSCSRLGAQHLYPWQLLLMFNYSSVGLRQSLNIVSRHDSTKKQQHQQQTCGTTSPCILLTAQCAYCCSVSTAGISWLGCFCPLGSAASASCCRFACYNTGSAQCCHGQTQLLIDSRTLVQSQTNCSASCTWCMRWLDLIFC